MFMEGMSMMAKILYLYSTSGTKIMLQYSPYASFLMPTMWNFSWWKTSLYLTVFFLMYMDELVCSNSDRNKEAIREK